MQISLYLADSCPSVLQLRHLLWATSKHDVYTTNEACIMHWSTLTETSTKVSLAGHWRHQMSHIGAKPTVNGARASW